MASVKDDVRQEYLSGKSTVRKIAAKYGVSPTTVQTWAKKEGWQKALVQIDTESVTELVRTISAKNGQVQTRVQDMALLLMDTLEDSVRKLSEIRPINPRGMMEYASALRSLQQVIDSRPTELDMEEQKARIEKLKKESMDTGSKAVTVRIEGCDDYAG